MSRKHRRNPGPAAVPAKQAIEPPPPASPPVPVPLQNANAWLIAAVVSAALAVLAPWHLARMIGYAALLMTGGTWILQSAVRIRSVLLACFVLAFIFAPYWNIAKHNGPLPPWLAAVMLGVVGVAWAFYNRPLAGYTAPALPRPREWLGWTALLAVWLVIEHKPVWLGIPWRGDEYGHVREANTLIIAAGKHLFHEPVAAWTLVLLVVTVLVRVSYVFLERRARAVIRKPLLAASVDAVCRYGWMFAAATVWCVALTPVFPEWDAGIRRYPFFRSWLATLTAWDKAGTVLLEPWWMRTGSLVFMYAFPALAFSWMYRYGKSWLVAFLSGLMCLTLPITTRYGSMYYIEPFLAPLLFAVAMWPGFLAADSSRKARSAIGSAALCMIPLIKETSLAITGTVAVLRGWSVLKNNRPFSAKFFKAALSELLYVAMISAGVALFLYYQSGVAPRSGKPAWSQLIEAVTWNNYLKSLWDNTGLLPFLALGGIAWLALKRRWINIFFALGVMGACFVIFGTDSWRTLGYARQNLNFVPVIAALALPAVAAVGTWKRSAAVVLLICMILTNMALSPYDFKSGITKPYWGCHNRLWFETYYPVKETVDWLSVNRRDRPTMVYMHDYGFSGLMWAMEDAGMTNNVKNVTLDELCPMMLETGMVKPEQAGNLFGYLYWGVYDREAEALAVALNVARLKQFPIVVYMCVNASAPPSVPPQNMSGYTLAALYRTPYRALAIFEKP